MLLFSFRCTCHNGEINTIHGNRKWLLAREGNATVPPILGTKLKKDEFLPFEEAAFVTRFHTPDFPRLPTTKSSSKLTPCDSTSRLVDSLAIPTDIVSAHPGSLITNSREMDMEDPVIEEQEENESPSSDSSSLDGVIELFMMTGRDLAEAVMLIIPEAIQKGDPQWRRDFAKFNSCLMEPWDGPALISFTGKSLGSDFRSDFRS